MSFFLFLPLLFIYIFGLINLVGINPDLAVRHGIHFITGVVVFFIISRLKIRAHFLGINAQFLYWIFIGLLILVLYFGLEVKGSRRWFDFYFFQFQPSEFFKIFFIIFLAQIFSNYEHYKEKRTIFLKVLGYTILPFILIFRQPDLGSAIVIFMISFVMIFHSEVPKKHILYFFIFVFLLLPAAWFMLHDYQKDRIISFVKPSYDLSGTSYNITQATIAIGSGEMFGRGLGLGKQSRLYFLPEAQTDFAFSSFVEQFGFLGGFLLILLFLFLFLSLFRKAYQYLNQKDRTTKFYYFYVIGFTALLVSQVAVNIGMNLHLLPIAGITLPFVSYGGSSLLTLMIGLALLP